MVHLHVQFLHWIWNKLKPRWSMTHKNQRFQLTCFLNWWMTTSRSVCHHAAKDVVYWQSRVTWKVFSNRFATSRQQCHQCYFASCCWETKERVSIDCVKSAKRFLCYITNIRSTVVMNDVFWSFELIKLLGIKIDFWSNGRFLRDK